MAQLRRKIASIPRRPVARGTLPGEIYREIKKLILDGGIAPGELVTIQGLADAFGVSAMPVREALQRLTAEKALKVVSGRSVGIPELEATQLRDLCRVRIEVETLATRWAAANLRAEDIRRLDGLVNVMATAVSAGDARRYVRANHEFHFAIYRAAGSDTLLAIIEGLWLQVSPYFHLLHGSGNYVSANHQHRQLLAALKNDDSVAASQSIRADIEGAAKVLLSLLE
jgi:DNA-binding GntR family transcriptional regulator